MFNISIAQISIHIYMYNQMCFTIHSRNQIKSNQMLVLEEKGKPEYPEKNLSEQSREPTIVAKLVTPENWFVKKQKIMVITCTEI